MHGNAQVRPLPGLALDALKEALDFPVWHALFCRFMTSPGEPWRHLGDTCLQQDFGLFWCSAVNVKLCHPEFPQTVLLLREEMHTQMMLKRVLQAQGYSGTIVYTTLLPQDLTR